jgi:hypothetical protein
MNLVVAHFQDGRVLKGTTSDFFPARPAFHVFEEGRPPGTKPVDVRVADLKALFFVKSLEGDPEHQETRDPAKAGTAPGRRIRVRFKDGEILVGITQGYDRARPGFFVVPVDPLSNNERCFVVVAATEEVSFL